VLYAIFVLDLKLVKWDAPQHDAPRSAPATPSVDAASIAA
jgi:hypothetical protein